MRDDPHPPADVLVGAAAVAEKEYSVMEAP